MIDTKKNIEEFENLYNEYILPRDGGDKLLEFIRKSDFYTAPASTKYHLSEEGGLLQHSLNVFHCLMSKASNPTWANIITPDKYNTVACVALLHDLCKTYFYDKELKNTKTYDPEIVAKFSGNNVKGVYGVVSDYPFKVSDGVLLGQSFEAGLVLTKLTSTSFEAYYVDDPSERYSGTKRTN